MILLAGSVAYFASRNQGSEIADRPAAVEPIIAREVVLTAPPVTPEPTEAPAQAQAPAEQTEVTKEPAKARDAIVAAPSKGEEKKPNPTEAATTVVLSAEDAKKKAIAEIEAELGSPIAGVGVVEIFYQENIASLKTEEVEVAVDGKPIAKKSVANEKAVESGIMIYTGPVSVGSRTVELRVRLRGDGDVFSYVKDYAFHIDHIGNLKVDPKSTTRLTLSAAESKNVTKEWTDKFSLKAVVSTREAGSDMATR